MILDLDNTLLHTSDKIYDISDESTSGVDLYDLIIKNNKKLITKLRPYLIEFFAFTIKKFEIYIYTMGDRHYAE